MHEKYHYMNLNIIEITRILVIKLGQCHSIHYVLESEKDVKIIGFLYNQGQCKLSDKIFTLNWSDYKNTSLLLLVFVYINENIESKIISGLFELAEKRNHTKCTAK